MVPCSGIVRGDQMPPTVIIFDGFCNWLEFNGVLGFFNEKVSHIIYGHVCWDGYAYIL